MEDVPDNPATRLLDFLTKLKSYGADAQVRISICRALDLDTDMPLPEVLHYLTVVMSWPDEIESLVNGLTEVNKVRLLRWRPHIDETMVGLAHLTAPLQSTLAQYNVTDLTDLEHCADTLHFRAPEPVMTTEKLDDLGALIRQAIDAVIADTDLTDEARHWLVTQLRDVEQAVIHFRIAGYRGVEEAMERLCGGDGSATGSAEPGDSRLVYEDLEQVHAGAHRRRKARDREPVCLRDARSRLRLPQRVLNLRNLPSHSVRGHRFGGRSR